jgi:hypothetical protein
MMTQGFAPATARTMIVIKAMIRETPVIGGMSAGLRVVFLLIFLLEFLLLIGFWLVEFLLELLLLLLMLVLLGEEPSLPVSQVLGSSAQLPLLET